LTSTALYTLSLHDALPLSCSWRPVCAQPAATNIAADSSTTVAAQWKRGRCGSVIVEAFPGTDERRGSSAARDLHGARRHSGIVRSEEHTSELQSRENLVCR